MKICPNCGAENSDGALKCVLCDYEFDDLDSDTFEDNTETDYHETSDNKPAQKANDNADDDRISSVFTAKEKKSPVGYVIAGIIAVLLIGCGILGGMLLMKNKKNNQNDSSNISASVTDASENKSNAATTTLGSDTAMTSETTMSTVTNELVSESTTIELATDTTAPSLSQEEISIAKSNALDEFWSSNSNISSIGATTDYDINGDSIPELIIAYMGISGDNNYHIYYYNGSQYVELKDCWGGLEISVDKHYIHETHYGGGEVHCYYEISDDYSLNKLDEISSMPLYNNYDYFRNGQSINSSEYYAAFNFYNDMNWIDINPDSISNESKNSLGEVEADVQDYNYLDMYSGYSYIENAPSDMTFVDNSNYSAIPKGIIKTESTGLNLRKGPGTSYDVIIEIPKGEMVYVYGRNSEWCYVGYSSGTGRFVHTDFGYVSKDYLSISVG